MNPALEKLLQHPRIWQGQGGLKKNSEGLSTGFDELDALLPAKGWPVGELTEIISPQDGIGELRLLLPSFVQLSQRGEWLAWIAPPYLPYPLALNHAGLDLTRLILIRPENNRDQYWALEQILRSGVCRAVLSWFKTLQPKLVRRLQLAAEAGQCVSLLFSPQASEHSPASLRLALQYSQKGLKVYILKRRGAWATGPVYLHL